MTAFNLAGARVVPEKVVFRLHAGIYFFTIGHVAVVQDLVGL